MKEECGFCNYDRKYLIDETELSIAMSFPTVLKVGHFVIAPKEHLQTYLMLNDKQLTDMFQLAKRVGDMVQKMLNCEKFYIASICDGGSHFHIHFIAKKSEDPKLGLYLFSDSGWKGALTSSVSVDEIQEFVSEYKRINNKEYRIINEK